MSKILPVQQSLIPVSFKRKIAYTGSFIEEYIEKEKVQEYFEWFKENNHLYKDLNLDNELIDKFISEAEDNAEKFEKFTKEQDSGTSSFEVNITNVSNLMIALLMNLKQKLTNVMIKVQYS